MADIKLDELNLNQLISYVELSESLSQQERNEIKEIAREEARKLGHRIRLLSLLLT